jgi:lipopolysaccharide export system permease protein
LHRKYTSAFACAVLFLIGAPFGVIVRKGGLALPVIAATLLYILFLILYKLGESLGKNGTIDPVAGMWAPPLIMVPLAVWLVYMANTDAAMLQLETYRLPRFIKSLVRRKQ